MFTTDETIRKSFDFTTIRDNFRQHIHNRRNADVSELILLDPQVVQNLIKLKKKSFELLLMFSKSTKEQTKVKTFTSFEEFTNFLMNEEEILNSEIWKLEAVFNYLDQLELDLPPAESNIESQVAEPMKNSRISIN